jgi:hypothetical protein
MIMMDSAYFVVHMEGLDGFQEKNKPVKVVAAISDFREESQSYWASP